MAAKKTKRKSKNTKRSEPDYFVYLQNPLEVYHNILDTTKTQLTLLQLFEELASTRKEKNKKISEFESCMKDIKKDVTILENMLPEQNLVQKREISKIPIINRQKEVIPEPQPEIEPIEQPVPKKETREILVQESPELRALREEIQNIESKIKGYESAMERSK